MPSKKHRPDEVIGKLREAEVVLAQGATTAEACRRIAAEPEKRAELFVANWKKERARASDAPTRYERDQASANLTSMAKSLHRDPQLESLLQNRRAELGLKSSATASLSHDLQQWLGRSRGMGISM